MSELSFRCEIQDRVATITLDRPARLNALTFTVYTQLAQWFREPPPEVRAVVITGAGRGFCSGGDVEDIIGQLFSRDASGLYAFTRMTGELVAAIRAFPWPVIAAVNGTAAGAGAIIAMASDIRYAAHEAKVAFLFNKVGLSGADMGACYLLPRIIGLGRATEILMTGEPFGAEEGHRIGFFNKILPLDALVPQAQALATRLAAGPAFALRITKEQLNRELDVSLPTALEMEVQAQALCMLHPDFREAHEAWKEKRAPRYTNE